MLNNNNHNDDNDNYNVNNPGNFNVNENNDKSNDKSSDKSNDNNNNYYNISDNNNNNNSKVVKDLQIWNFDDDEGDRAGICQLLQLGFVKSSNLFGRRSSINDRNKTFKREQNFNERRREKGERQIAFLPRIIFPDILLCKTVLAIIELELPRKICEEFKNYSLLRLLNNWSAHLYNIL